MSNTIGNQPSFQGRNITNRSFRAVEHFLSLGELETKVANKLPKSDIVVLSRYEDLLSSVTASEGRDEYLMFKHKPSRQLRRLNPEIPNKKTKIKVQIYQAPRGEVTNQINYNEAVSSFAKQCSEYIENLIKPALSS